MALKLFFLWLLIYTCNNSIEAIQDSLEHRNNKQLFFSGYIQSCSSLYRSLVCWGSNLFGEGNIPLPLTHSFVISASIGRHYVCVVYVEANSVGIRTQVSESGKIACWGNNQNGQLQIQDRFKEKSVTMVRAGDYHTCVKGRVEVVCRGLNGHGQLEIPSGLQIDVKAFTVRNLSTCVISEGNLVCFGNIKYDYQSSDPSISIIAELGYDHLCHTTALGVICSGDNFYGQLNSPVGEYLMTRMNTYGNHTCGVRYYGEGSLSVVCWGQNDAGQTDLNLVGNTYYYPILGDSHSCYVKGKYYVKCIGNYQYGILQIPKAVSNYIYKFVLGGKFTCIIIGGQLKCYGNNQERLNQVPASFLQASEQISAGYSHVCASFVVMGMGSLYRCWGLKSKEIGIITPPQEIAIKHTLIDQRMTSGYKFTCSFGISLFNRAIKKIICWGINDRDQLNIPSMILNDPTERLEAGTAHMCSINEFYHLLCWGRSDQGQTLVPAHMAVNSGYVSCGAYHTCAVSKVNQGECWGNNAKGQTDIPASLRYSMNVVEAGGEFTCGLYSNSHLRCWGKNLHVLKESGGFSNSVYKLEVGHDHICVQNQDRQFKCWGQDDKGQVSVNLPE